MSRRISYGITLILCLYASLMTACSFVATEQRSSGDQRVLIPWSTDGQYRFEAVPLNSLVNIASLTGRSALFMLSPTVVDKQLAGFQPRVRAFRDGDGVHVPTDELSLHLLTLYAHIEKLQELDAAVGLGDLLPKPRIVGVEVRIPQRQRGQVENNALYSPQLDALLFVPYKGDELPLTVNAGVVAHEHFHALFNYMVLKPAKARIKAARAAQVHAGEEKLLREVFEDIPADIDRESVSLEDWEAYHVNLLRAINEGLADVWGWIYSGDNIFVRRSIPVVRKTRDLEPSGSQRLYTLEAFRQMTLAASIAGDESARAYELGTLYARAVKNVFEPHLRKSGRPRQDLAKLVARVLPKIKERLEGLDKSRWLKPGVLLELFARELPPEQRELCPLLMSADAELGEVGVAKVCAPPAKEEAP